MKLMQDKLWSRFDSEVEKRSENERQRAGNLEEENRSLKTELEKFRRSGKKEEMDFAEEVQTWPGIWISDKLSRTGDYIIAYKDPGGYRLNPEILVEVKEKAIEERHIAKLVEDAKERDKPLAIIVTQDGSGFRGADWDNRFGERDGVLVLRTTRPWLRAELDVLKPIVNGIRAKGLDFLRNNADLANEVRRTLSDLAEIQTEIGKAEKASTSAGKLLAKYSDHLSDLCERTCPQKESGQAA